MLYAEKTKGIIMKKLFQFFIFPFLLLFFTTFAHAANQCTPTDHTGSVSSTNSTYTNTDTIYWNADGAWNRKRYYIQVTEPGIVNISIVDNTTPGDSRFNASFDSCPDYQDSGKSWSHTFASADDFNIDVTPWSKTGTQSYTLTITFTPNQPPVANAGSDQNVTLGDILTLDGSASSDPDNNIVSYAWTEGGIPLSTNISPHLIFPTAGTRTITLTVTDAGGLSSTDTVTIKINTPPVVEDMNFTILQNTPVSFELNAADADGDAIISYPIFLSPAHGSLSGPESNMTYTPDINYTGVDTFTYKAYDGTDYSNESAVTIHIYPPATAIADDFNTTYNTLLNGNVLNNDLGLNIQIIDFNTTTLHGALSIGGDGAFSYLPDELFDGNDTFSYTIKDDFNLTSTATVTMHVYPPRSDLSIIKTAPASVDSGLAIDYTLNIRNREGAQYITATNVRVIDALPNGASYSGITAPSGWTCGYTGGVVTCDAFDISVGYSGTIVIHAFAPNILGDSINTATVTSDTIDPDLSNNTSSATTTITGPDVDLSITKAVSSPTVTITDSFSYTLSVQNAGTADTTGVTVSDTLDASLGYISVDGGADWICSQGSTIVCNYVAHSGLFAAGASSNIVITVRAPATEANITNTASVTSDILDVNTGNDSDSVNVSIQNGTIKHDDFPLEKYKEFLINGDFTFMGNANINKPSGDVDQNYNDQINMTFVNTADDGNNFNSSSSQLPTPIDNNYTIKWAGLYWEGHICDITDSIDTTKYNNNTLGCKYDHIPNINSYNEAESKIGNIKLKIPGSSYQNIQANTLNTIVTNKDVNYYDRNGQPQYWYSRKDLTYSAFKDITKLVKRSGVYSVANMVLTEGKTSYGGNYGGWVILIVYEDPSHALHYKDISIFNGFQLINVDDNHLPISGFITPKSGNLNASLAFFAADGDPGSGGVGKMKVKKTDTYAEVTNTLNPAGNLMNSTISAFGIDFNNVGRTYGVDADRIDVHDFLTNDQTSTDFIFDVTNPSNSNKKDVYTISMFTFATDLTSPLIDNLVKSAVIIDGNGSRRDAGPDEPIYPASSLEYTISFKNTGDEVAEGVVIFDDFDFDGLSQALEINHFDTTTLKLFHGSGSTKTEISDPDCDYDNAHHRVYCNIPTVAINESYTMQFVVTVKKYFDTSIIDTNATNTAYAQYRNPNGNNYVEFYTTPAGEPVGGKSNALNSGVFTVNGDGFDGFISIDAINANYTYNRDKNITTKIVNKPFDIKLVHLDKNDVGPSPYQAWSNVSGDTRPMAVLVTLKGDGKPTRPLAVATFNNGTESTIARGLTLEEAHRADSLKTAYLDWRNILSRVSSTSACVVNPRQSTNLNGVPECFNSAKYIEDVFDRNKFKQIAICYGVGTPAGKSYPCDPLAYSTGGNLNRTNIYPDAYNHNYGCYQCIAQGYSHFWHYSSDDFAARPERFIFDSNNSSYPDLLRSGLEYNLSVTALEYNGDPDKQNPTKDYNTTDHFSDKFVLDPNNELSPAVKASLDDGNVTIAFHTNIKDGITVDENNDPQYNLGIKYDNVGKVGIELMDANWAWVDEDDTPEDCNATENSYGVAIEAGRSICGKVNNLRFIPDHFKVTSHLKNHRKDATFTYLYSEPHYNDKDKPHMSALVGMSIEAQNASDKITTNFKKDAYEHSISADLNITDWNTSFVIPAIRKDQHGNRLDANLETGKKSFDKLLLGFGTKNDANGTYTIETNSSTPYKQRLMFNYKRIRKMPKNPFVINGSEINATVASKYTSETTPPAKEGTAIIKGYDIADGNATFYYARVRPASDFYKNITGTSENTPVFIDVYCDFGYATCNALGIDTVDGEFNGNELKWWLALKHDQSKNDGNVTLKVSTASGTLNKTKVVIVPGNNAEDKNITVSLPTTVTRPYTVKIDLDTNNPTDTNDWLIHNPKSPVPPAEETKPSPFEQVEFIGNSNWTGHGETGNVVGSNANKKANRRLGW